ncbi:hypothetical protein ACHQM5_001408 [Ranunculus cassubicifolius]
MEKRTCKLCFKTFSNGRALGGHMRSHMVKLQTPSPPLPLPATPTHPSQQLIENETDDDSASSSSFSSSEEDDKGLSYGLRENPKKSFRLVDPEFSSFVVVDAGSVVQDRESETEESSKNPSRRRSKRHRKSGFFDLPQHLRNQDEQHRMNMMLMMMNKKSKLSNSSARSEVEPEPVSSVSDTTPEEDVAWCLMMLSRGIRTSRNADVEDDDDQNEEKSMEEIEESEEEELEEIKIRVKRSRGKYQCGTCKKFFRSYQALGGHRASHKKIKGCNSPIQAQEYENGGNVGSVTVTNSTNTCVDRRTHECPVCFRVFGSGQALGGHKRSHLTGSSSSPILQPITTRNPPRENLIDLNLPAPMDDEDQIELSAVSDAEFVDRF